MNLNELRTFLAIVEKGSLAKAADQLNVTQSTVTARLKSLEDLVGRRLVNRSKTGASLTAAGQQLHRYAQSISDLWRQAGQEIGLMPNFKSAFNMGCHPDLWVGFGDQLFDIVRNRGEVSSQSIWHGSDKALGEWLQNGLIDFALTYTATAKDGQKVVGLEADALILVSTTKSSPVKFDPAYVYVESGEAFAQFHAAAYSDAGTASLHFGSAELALNHLLKHGGSAYLSKRRVDTLLKNQQLFCLSDAPTFSRPVFACFSQDLEIGNLLEPLKLQDRSMH